MENFLLGGRQKSLEYVSFLLLPCFPTDVPNPDSHLPCLCGWEHLARTYTKMELPQGPGVRAFGSLLHLCQPLQCLQITNPNDVKCVHFPLRGKQLKHPDILHFLLGWWEAAIWIHQVCQRLPTTVSNSLGPCLCHVAQNPAFIMRFRATCPSGCKVRFWNQILCV